MYILSEMDLFTSAGRVLAHQTSEVVMFLNQRTTGFQSTGSAPTFHATYQAMEARLRRALVCQQMVFLIRLGQSIRVPARHQVPTTTMTMALIGWVCGRRQVLNVIPHAAKCIIAG
jgi:hypothetical protein